MKPERDPFARIARFEAKLFRTPGKGGWHFVTVPTDLAPPVMGSWGMTPVIAKVDGKGWNTTIWHDKQGRSYLPVPKKIRGKKEDGELVSVEFRVDRERAVGPAHPLE